MTDTATFSSTLRAAARFKAYRATCDLANNVHGVVVVDTRNAKSYAEGHVPGALNIWRFELTAEDTKDFDREATYVTYGTGPDCNGDTKGALRARRTQLQRSRR